MLVTDRNMPLYNCLTFKRKLCGVSMFNLKICDKQICVFDRKWNCGLMSAVF